MCSWSGGKDSCFALMNAMSGGYKPVVLLNMMNENGKISRSHGLPHVILDRQARAMNLPIIKVPATWNDYEKKYIDALQDITREYHLEAAIFGDIDLQPHREWEEKVCGAAGIQAVLPLWGKNRKGLVYEMIDREIHAIIVSCNTMMGEKFLGQRITKELVNELEKMGIDACGENGEYHTAVINCPLFSDKIKLPAFDKVTHKEYCFLTWRE